MKQAEYIPYSKEKMDGIKDKVTYDELINEMIADAWYMVTEYHLNLGSNAV